MPPPPSSFDELLSLIERDISKKWTQLRNVVISPRERLSVTIKYLASGYNYSDLQHLTRIHKSTLRKVIPEVCDAIYRRLKDKYMKVR